jgi:site-specific recombinase XerD
MSSFDALDGMPWHELERRLAGVPVPDPLAHADGGDGPAFSRYVGIRSCLTVSSVMYVSLLSHVTAFAPGGGALLADRVIESAAVDLYRTALCQTSGVAAVDTAVVLGRSGVREGQPFVLGPDGSYDVHLNRFFRELDGWGVRADNSVAAYARDVMLFCRFLHETRGGKSIWDCGQDDLRAYKVARLRIAGPHQVSVSTWNRSLAALDKWVQWSLYEGLLTAEPFRYLDRNVLTPQGIRQVRVNAEQEHDSQRSPLRFVPFEDYLLWRDVGLRGELPDGQPDPRWRGRHGERNAVFADLLVHTGMRLGEASSLLVPEIPPIAGAAKVIGDVHLSAAVTKRHKARTVFCPLRVLRAVHHYIDMDRDAVVQRRQARDAYAGLESVLGVRSCGRHALTLTDKRGSWSYSKIGPGPRRQLTRLDEAGRPTGPLWLWLGEAGLPLEPSSWQAAFRRANERCARFDIPIEIHAHTLRHVYAVHMLGLLLRQTIRALDPNRDQITAAHLRRLLIGNPMRKLQLLLGHSQESTVYLYLDVLDEAQEIVLAALADWDAQAAVWDQVTVEGEPSS